MMTDPIEHTVAAALEAREVAYVRDGDGETRGLDFYLPAYDVYIECKQFHTPRTTDQMSRAANVIVVQGREAALFFWAMSRL